MLVTFNIPGARIQALEISDARLDGLVDLVQLSLPGIPFGSLVMSLDWSGAVFTVCGHHAPLRQPIPYSISMSSEMFALKGEVFDYFLARIRAQFPGSLFDRLKIISATENDGRVYYRVEQFV